MFKMSVVALAFAAIFSDYPAFLKSAGVVESYTDLGPIVEMIVRCPEGTGILSYSKIDKRFCSSKHACFPKLTPAVADTCG